MLPTRDKFQTKRHLYIESEGIETHLSCKWMPKESQDSGTYIRENRTQNKDSNNRQRRTLYNNKGII